MAGWMERLKAYQDIGSLAGRKAEDFVSRKVLRGLGWTEKALPLLCSKTDVEWDGSKPLWSTVQDVLNSLSNGYFSSMSPNRKYILDVRRARNDGTFWKDREEMLELEEIACSAGDGMILLGREPIDNPCGTACVFVKKSEKSFARYGDLPYWVGKPVALFRDETPKSMIWIRRIEDLFADMADAMNWDIPEYEA